MKDYGTTIIVSGGLKETRTDTEKSSQINVLHIFPRTRLYDRTQFAIAKFDMKSIGSVMRTEWLR